jgi:hypothetical protein
MNQFIIKLYINNNKPEQDDIRHDIIKKKGTPMKTTNYIFIGLLILLGSLHTAMTPVFYKLSDLNALWFAGAGLSFIFVGIINIFRVKTGEHSIIKVCLSVNLLALCYCIFICLKLMQPQAFICVIIMVALCGLSLIDTVKKNK